LYLAYQQYPYPLPSITTKPSNAILIAGILLALLYYPLLGHLVFMGQPHNISTLIYSRLFIWSELVLLYIYATRMERLPVFLWKDEPHDFGFWTLSFFVLYLLCMAAGFIAYLPRLFGYHDNMQRIVSTEQLVSKNLFVLFFSCITAGITEEFIFRGYMLPRLELLFNNKLVAALVSALMFGILHYGYFSITKVVATALIGLLFALHYQKYRNIKLLMAFHALLDTVSFLAYRIHPVHLH
jgi:membrane protease YdiL (CAAX protease family)